MQIELTAFPYDSEVIRYESDGMPVYDRAITSKEYRNLFLKYFTEGVFPNPSDNFQIVENSSQGALVKKGYANVRGVLIELKQDTPIIFEQADSLDRIDRVVLRHNDTKSVRYADVVILKGSPSNSPQAPNITRDETIWDIVLADVRIRKNSSNVTQAQITDRRLDSELCGIVAGTIKEVDTTTLYNQIQSDLSQFKENEQAEFLEWFEKIKGQLGEDQAGNLQLQIDDLDSRTEILEEATFTGGVNQAKSEFSGITGDNGIEIARIEGAYKTNGTPTPENPIEPKFFHATNFYTSGKNLFDGQLELGSIDNLTGELSSDNKCLRSKNFIRVIQNSTVTLSNDLGYACYIYEYDSNKGFIKYTSKSETNTLKLSDSTNFIKFRSVSGQTQNNLNVKYQLETSYSKSEYTPFKGSSSTPVDIELRALPNDVKDIYDNGIITRKVGYIEFDGSDDEKWVEGGSLTKTMRFYIELSNSKQQAEGICNINRWVKTGFSTDDELVGVLDNKLYFRINKNRLSVQDVNGFKNFIKTNHIKVWYELATPTTEQYSIPTLHSYYPFTNAWCDSELETNITWNALTGKSSILDGQGNIISKGYMTPQDNFLANSDFASGIINQKGQTTYTANDIYTIDMWRLVGSGSFGGKVTVGTNDILIENNGTEDVFFVNKTDLSYLIDRDYLIYVNAIGLGNNNAYVYCDAESGKVGRTQLTQGENFIKINGKPTTLGFELASTTRLRINKVKLEKGSRFTGMKPWNKGIEFAKCINKYRFELNNYYPIYEITGNKAIIPINHNGMDKKPSVIVDGGFCKGADGLTATFTSYKVVENKDNSTTVEVTFNKNIQGTSACLNVIIDSYDY